MNIKISVILPCYNVEKYIRDCLDSILAQTLKEWEAILVDDGSTDSTPQICDEYAARDSRFLVIHKKNGGVSSARNACIQAVTNTPPYYGLINFVDPDDWIDEHAFEWCWEEYQNSNADAIEFYFGWCQSIGGENYYPKDMKHELWVGHEQIVKHYIAHSVGYGQDGLDGLFRGESIANYRKLPYIWTFSYKKELLLSSGIKYDEDLKMMEDMIFLMKYMNICNKVARVPHCCYSYRYNNEGTTAKRAMNFSSRLEDKIGLYYHYSDLRQEVDVIDLHDQYMGSHVISSLKHLLMAKTWRDYNKCMEFHNLPEVQEAWEKANLDKAPFKFKIPMGLIKNHLSGLLFFGIWMAKKLGLEKQILKYT